MNTLEASTMRAPYRSINQPTTGDAPDAASPPKLAAPAINVRLHPKSSARGNMNTAMVRLAAAFLTICVLLADPKTTHP